MSISLKNHEDRIAALEKQTQTPKAVFVTPDYGKAQNIPFKTTSSYTCKSNGFVTIDFMGNYGSGYYVKVNGTLIHSGYDNRDTEIDCQFVLPVVSGDVVSWSHNTDSGRTGIKFIPYRLTIL